MKLLLCEDKIRHNKDNRENEGSIMRELETKEEDRVRRRGGGGMNRHKIPISIRQSSLSYCFHALYLHQFSEPHTLVPASAFRTPD